jgi:hypothetical protein
MPEASNARDPTALIGFAQKRLLNCEHEIGLTLADGRRKTAELEIPELQLIA